MNQSETNLTKIVNQPYKYGFQTEVETDTFSPGLNEDVIRKISKKKNEPPFVTQFRLQAYKKWKRMNEPDWHHLELSPIDYQNIVYYSAPKFKEQLASLDDLDPEIKAVLDKLNIPIPEQKKLANVAVDVVFDSVSIINVKGELNKLGIIFCSMSEAIALYPRIVEKFLGTVVPSSDNFFAALNSCAFSDGSFCYLPKNVSAPYDLQTYFRINEAEAGQFERTLIIAEEGSYVSYLEGCTAPFRSTNQMHAAIVELITFKNAEIKYSTVQNWYSGDEAGNGGIYNFVTKRGLCLEENAKISWTQVETGSGVTWKYPSCVLLGKNAIGEFYSVALTNDYQQADTGTKMVHLGKNTKSQIISKGVSTKYSRNTYRGLVKIGLKASNSRNFSQCDSLLLGDKSQSNTFPYLFVYNSTAKVEHEASVSKVGEEQIFYFLQRGINLEKSISLIISGFCSQVCTRLPLEFSVEVDYLLRLKIEGSVG